MVVISDPNIPIYILELKYRWLPEQQVAYMMNFWSFLASAKASSNLLMLSLFSSARPPPVDFN